MPTHWVYSITTRIKTMFTERYMMTVLTHWVYSITTRIKTSSCCNHWQSNILIEYIPLQQGLRLIIFFRFIILLWLIEYIPLQQGLRLLFFFYTLYFFITHWVYSITTRIKTFLNFLRNDFFSSLSIFHYNKD